MIKDFRDAKTQSIWERRLIKGVPADIAKVALRKLRYLDAAQSLEDLRIPPANRLEALKGNRRGQHSIRVNDQFRICFIWKDKDAHGVELVDYH
ncbi:type II toxin-antitoxin system RelE/ParE family toxin [Phyllobacterium sp. LjRoot231]|uniref:type II toxin-antitoxin system RelE/ParE family toxin n=1 Tax=Phyllobacterium sp. LjRoot231 TaxID=3342289 RepID=UPI003ECCA528